MKKYYVKKPIVIEAIQWEGTNIEEILDFCGADQVILDNNRLYIETPFGEIYIKIKDYIVKGKQGEFFSATEDVLLKYYEEYKK